MQSLLVLFALNASPKLAGPSQPVLAAEEGWSGETEGQELAEPQDTGESPPELSPDMMAQAASAPEVSKTQIRWLRPRLGRLPPSPRLATDFTAYTLDFGEVKLGLSNTQVGLLPRTQVGSNLPLNLLGVYNGNLKVDALRLGPVDVAVSGAGYRYTQPAFRAQYLSVGPTVSVRFGPHLGVHAGAQLWSVGMDGTFSAGQVYAPLQLVDETGIFPNIHYSGQAATLRLASDLRLNRRDSFVLDASGVVWMRDVTGGGAKVPAMLQPFAAGDSFELGNSYRVSVAYQMDLKRLSLRAGLGVSAPSVVWALSTFEVSYRFGGKIKTTERHQRSAWKRDRRGVRRGEQGY